MSLSKGSFKFEKYPLQKKKCFCSEYVVKNSCYHTWLLAQTEGKFVVESNGHCYLRDSNAQLVLDTEKGDPEPADADIFKKVGIGAISNMYIELFL